MATIDDIKIASIPTWNGKGTSTEYERWSLLVRLKLEEKGIKEALKKDLSSSTDNKEKKADAQARNLIVSKVEGVAFNMVKNLKNAHNMMVKLNDCYLASQNKETRVTDLFKFVDKGSNVHGECILGPQQLDGTGDKYLWQT